MITLTVSKHTPLAVSELSSSSEYGEHGGPEGNGPTSLTGGEGEGSAEHTCERVNTPCTNTVRRDQLVSAT